MSFAERLQVLRWVCAPGSAPRAGLAARRARQPCPGLCSRDWALRECSKQPPREGLEGEQQGMCISPPGTGRDKGVQHSREELLGWVPLGVSVGGCTELERQAMRR